MRTGKSVLLVPLFKRTTQRLWVTLQGVFLLSDASQPLLFLSAVSGIENPPTYATCSETPRMFKWKKPWDAGGLFVFSLFHSGNLCTSIKACFLISPVCAFLFFSVLFFIPAAASPRLIPEREIQMGLKHVEQKRNVFLKGWSSTSAWANFPLFPC